MHKQNSRADPVFIPLILIQHQIFKSALPAVKWSLLNNTNDSLLRWPDNWPACKRWTGKAPGSVKDPGAGLTTVRCLPLRVPRGLPAGQRAIGTGTERIFLLNLCIDPGIISRPGDGHSAIWQKISWFHLLAFACHLVPDYHGLNQHL